MPLTQAERAKRYREKNKEKVSAAESLRRKRNRLVLKLTDPVKNKERLKKQRLAKTEYRKRKKTRTRGCLGIFKWCVK